MASSPNASGVAPIRPIVRWLILFLASIGFAFDIYELLMLPLIVRPALLEFTQNGLMMGLSRTTWIGLLFYLPAIFGGVFGLLGGYLTDWLGRRRVLTWSILLYAVSAFLAGFATNPLMLLVLRCTTFIGVCVEFVAAVAWLAELFPDPKQRERALGYTQAFSSLGGLLVAVAFGICNRYATDLYAVFPIRMPDFLVGFFGQIPTAPANMGWRFTLMSGLIPAIPLIVIRPFLPESPMWMAKKRAGTLKRPSILELFTTPELRKVTIVTTIMFACSYGAAFGAIQHIPRIVPGLASVKEEVQKNPSQQQRIESIAAAEYTKVQELGGLAGRFLLALLVIRIVSRRALLRVFQIPGLIVLPLVFYFFLEMPNVLFFEIPLEGVYLGRLPITTVSLGVFLCGLFTVGQFSFWGNYLPRVYPLHLRGTGESFAANIGGRMIGTSFAAVTVTLASFLPGSSRPEQLALAAAIVGGFVYLVGFIASFFLPEPKAEILPGDD